MRHQSVPWHQGALYVAPRHALALHKVDPRIMAYLHKTNRFLTDFFFQLSETEIKYLVSQNAIPPIHTGIAKFETQGATVCRNRGGEFDYLFKFYTQ